METTQTAYADPEAYASSETISVGDWMLTLFLVMLPLVGIIMLFVWGFSSSTPRTKANFAKAALIWSAIILVLYIGFFAMFGAAIMSGMSGSGY